MSERTSLPAWKETHQTLKECKPEDLNWPEFMELVASAYVEGDTKALVDEKLNASECNVDGAAILEEVQRTKELAERAANNTDQIKEGMR